MRLEQRIKNNEIKCEIFEDGVKYSSHDKNSNISKFVKFEEIGEDTYKYDVNSFTFADTFQYKYFFLISAGFFLFEIIFSKLDYNPFLFFFIGLFIYILVKVGTIKYINLNSDNYNGSLTFFDNSESYEFIKKIKEKRNKYLSEKYLLSRDKFKNIVIYEYLARYLVSLNLVNPSTLNTLDEHNKRIYELQNPVLENKIEQ